MRKVTWRRFNQSAKQLVLGQTTIKNVTVTTWFLACICGRNQMVWREQSSSACSAWYHAWSWVLTNDKHGNKYAQTDIRQAILCFSLHRHYQLNNDSDNVLTHFSTCLRRSHKIWEQSVNQKKPQVHGKPAAECLCQQAYTQIHRNIKPPLYIVLAVKSINITTSGSCTSNDQWSDKNPRKW